MRFRSMTSVREVFLITQNQWPESHESLSHLMGHPCDPKQHSRLYSPPNITLRTNHTVKIKGPSAMFSYHSAPATTYFHYFIHLPNLFIYP